MNSSYEFLIANYNKLPNKWQVLLRIRFRDTKLLIDLICCAMNRLMCFILSTVIKYVQKFLFLQKKKKKHTRN